MITRPVLYKKIYCTQGFFRDQQVDEIVQSIPERPDEASDSLSLSVGDYILIGVNRDGSASTSKKHYVGTVQSCDEDNLHVMFMTSKGSLLNIHNLYPIFGRIIFVNYVFFCFKIYLFS